MKILFLNDFRSKNWDLPKAEDDDGQVLTNHVYLRSSTFPSGFEEHVAVVGGVSGEHVHIIASFTNSGDVMRLLLVTDAVRRMGAARVSVFFTFLPYGRQDRVCGPGEALSARVFADLINAQNYQTVTSVHTHSDVLPGMLNNYLELRFTEHFKKALADHPDAVIVAPDAGAAKKVELIAEALGYQGEIAYAHKTRKNGVVEVSYIHGPIMREKTALIMDDICDGGATFIALAAKLKDDYKVSKVVLAVTHGIFSKGPKHLLENGVDVLYATNTVMHPACVEDEALINRVNLP